MKNIRDKKWTVVCLAIAIALGVGSVATMSDPDVVPVRLNLVFDGIEDTDDMCIWIHPTDTSLSTIIVADKAADYVVVFDLAGNVLQRTQLARNDAGSEQAGNIDIRYGIAIGDEIVDVVALNQRAPSQGKGMRIYKVDPETRFLTRIDTGLAMDHSNYGMCLYKSRVSGKLYYFATAKAHGVEQYELVDNGEGQLVPVLVRSWPQKKCEGAVADDELGYVYICEEATGVFRYGAEPDDSIEGTLVVATGREEGDFEKDAEGITLYYAPDGGYMIVSSQGSNSFFVYDRLPPHNYIKTFSLDGVFETDGIDVTNVNLGPDFPYGLFTCHANGDPSIAVVAAFEDLGLPIDTSYDPRTGTYQGNE